MLRKLISSKDLTKIITLNLHDKTTTNEVYLTIADLDKKKKAYSEEYRNLVGKPKLEKHKAKKDTANRFSYPTTSTICTLAG